MLFLKLQYYLLTFLRCADHVPGMSPPFFDELGKCVFHPAWRSHLGFHMFIADLLRSENLRATRENVLPARRGDHVLEFTFSSLGCCDQKAFKRLATVSFRLTVEVICGIQVHPFEFMTYRCAPCTPTCYLEIDFV